MLPGRTCQALQVGNSRHADCTRSWAVPRTPIMPKALGAPGGLVNDAQGPCAAAAARQCRAFSASICSAVVRPHRISTSRTGESPCCVASARRGAMRITLRHNVEAEELGKGESHLATGELFGNVPGGDIGRADGRSARPGPLVRLGRAAGAAARI